MWTTYKEMYDNIDNEKKLIINVKIKTDKNVKVKS